MKTKKQQIKHWIAKSTKTDKEIASIINCHPAYVYAIRRRESINADEAAEITGGNHATYKAVIPVATVGDVDAVLAERGARYGKFIDHAEVTQNLKNVMMTHLQKRERTLIVDQQEALEMIFHKIGRILNGDPNYADSWIDIAGYAKLVADRLEGKVR